MPKFKQWELIGIGLIIGIAVMLPPVPKVGGYNIVEKPKIEYNLEEQWENTTLFSNVKAVIKNLNKTGKPEEDFVKTAKTNSLLNFTKEEPSPLLLIFPQKNQIKVKAGKSNWQLKLEVEAKLKARQEVKIQISYAHEYPWGWCTYYIASKRFIPWGGNANQWIWQSQLYGYEIGYTPRVGAILITDEHWEYGHAAYVEAVYGDYIRVSEMNYTEFGVTSYRTLPYYYGVYIYERG